MSDTSWSAREFERDHAPSVSRYQLASTKAARKLSSLLNVDHVLRTVAETLTNDFEAKLVRVWLYEPEDDTLHRRVSSGPSNTNIEPPMSREGLPGYPYEVRRVIESQELFVSNELASDPNFYSQWVLEERLAAVAAFPLKVAGELRGILVYFCDRNISGEALLAIETLSTLAAISLNDMRLFDQLSRTKERYRTFVERSSEGILLQRFEAPLPVSLSEEEQIRHIYRHLILSEVSDSLAQQYGYHRSEELEGVPVRDIVPPTRENLRAMMDFARAGYQISDMELSQYDRHGDVRYFSLNLVGTPENGLLTEFWGTQRDITERKLAELALQESEEKYRSLFENALEGIFQSTLEGELLMVNPALASILGYDTAHDALANTSSATGLYVDPEEHQRMTNIVLAYGEVSDFETRFLRKDGSEVWVSLNVRASYDDEAIGRSLEGRVEDITERRKAEQTLKETRESERSRLARDLHDTALQDITYATQEIDVCRVLSDDSSTVRRLEKSNEALRRAVSELRHSIYDLREDDPSRRPFYRSLEILAQRGQRMFPQCDIILTPSEDMQDIRQDSRAAIELLYVIQEAISNTRKHSGATRLHIGLSVDDRAVNVTVRDNGTGFDPQERPQGTGVDSMRERMAGIGGDLYLRSAPGRGTSLELRVPSETILKRS